MFKPLIILFIFISVISCTKNIDDSPPVQGIYGTWVFDKMDSNEIKIFIRKDSFGLYQKGYTFYKDNSCLLNLKTKCGNPPIFDKVLGDYIKTNDTIRIKYFLNRKNKLNLLIKGLKKDTLKVIRIN